MALTKNTLKEVPAESKPVEKTEIKTESNAPKKKTEKAKGKEKKSTSNPFNTFISFFKNEKTHKITGTFFLIISIYLLTAFCSHLFTWRNNYLLIDKSFWSIILDSSIKYKTNIGDTLDLYNFTGTLGAKLSFIFIIQGFGISAFLFVLFLFITGFKLAFNLSILPVGKTFRHCFFYLIWISICLGFVYKQFNYTTNEIFCGFFGYYTNIWLNNIIGWTGTSLLLFLSLITFLVVSYNMSFRFRKKEKSEGIIKNNQEVDNENKMNDVKINSQNPINKNKEFLEDESIELTPDEEKEITNFEVINKIEKKNKPINTDDIELTIENIPAVNPGENKKLQAKEEMEHKTIDSPYDPTLELSGYKFPTFDLLNDYEENKTAFNKEELEANKNRIVTTLNNYQIAIDKIKATIGPTVTLYELVPAPGVRISKIKNLEDDIALSLSALGIRIIAPIPGKGTIGIEVPNLKPEIVSMKTMLTSEKFQNSTYELPIALGKTISNECYIANLATMPHLLVAGATGQGKSVGINSILASLLYKKHPSQLKFVLVDPKKVELTLFSKIERHYLAKLPDSEEAIITDTKKVVRTLNSLCIEMELRYDLLKDAGVRNLKEYNVKFISRKLNPNNGHRFLPYIVLVVDEFADFIMTAGKEVELPIARLAQLARAIGIHLIIATQRPSVNIITGTIKANFPARIGYRVTSKIDSRTILDTGGADQLVGRGDMLLSLGGDIIRLQTPFIDTPEIEKITEFIGSQRGFPDAFHLPECPDEEAGASNDFDPKERDEFFEDAARLIVQHQQGSTSLIQRKMKLGYNRAGRIIDQLEAVGIVGPFEGSKAREVRIKDELSLEDLLKSLNTKFN